MTSGRDFEKPAFCKACVVPCQCQRHELQGRCGLFDVRPQPSDLSVKIAKNMVVSPGTYLRLGFYGCVGWGGLIRIWLCPLGP